MDQTTTPRRRMRWAAVALLGALSLVAAACGDDDGGDEAAGGGGEDFCQTMQEIDDQEFAGGEPTAEEVEAIMDRVSQLDPPAEIEESFDQMVDGMQRAMVDPSSGPELADEIDQASEEVEAYMRDECGIG